MKPNLKNPIHFIALGFGSGLIKPAPGTWGSLMGLFVAIFLWQLTACQTIFILLTVLGFIGGCYICQKTSEDFGVHDDGRIVWDEMVAIFMIFSFLPEYNWLYYGLTFAIFRFFDILKPYPIRLFDQKLTSGLGIMVDDILAAIYSLCTLYLIYWSL
ncbi:phosphatidylglycerophosphatase A [Muribacter muris]|uniref:Phosphatidylglycerophosphatase A n=1 Tax=Muribacter muris TaxID=67855 RepID=A0A4Y9K0G6_9PAST|nr:phosphatidylglycerophosphatase A [Muribacter muris]MBF0785103.1 phosphatidylglycerophosphatase A [Muribacter muris]MBF0826883.1 phosphatidylglycerophosphatase A [Muribacter muris]TFV10195.1 phosphatidylglycerophosphatase A [Muribacter muris]